jgi:hypothetical protein
MQISTLQPPPSRLCRIKTGGSGTSIYAARLFVWFVLYWWDPLNQDASDCVLGLFGKLARRRGCIGLVPCCFDLPCKSSWILNNCSLKIKLNHSWNFGGIGIFLWCCWKDLDEKILWNLFGKIWIQNVGDIDF